MVPICGEAVVPMTLEPYDILEVPYATIVSGEGTVPIITMEMARGYLDLRVKLGKLTADEATPMLEMIQAVGLFETGQELREHIAQFKLEEQNPGYKFALCSGCSEKWPHGRVVDGSELPLFLNGFSSIQEFLGLMDCLSAGQIAGLIQQAARANLAVDYFDSHERYSALREAFMAQYK